MLFCRAACSASEIFFRALRSEGVTECRWKWRIANATRKARERGKQVAGGGGRRMGNKKAEEQSGKSKKTPRRAGEPAAIWWEALEVSSKEESFLASFLSSFFLRLRAPSMTVYTGSRCSQLVSRREIRFFVS